MMESETPRQRFTKQCQVRASHHDIVCNYGLDTENCVQIFWYECINDNLSEEEIKEGLHMLNEAKKIKCQFLMSILDVSQKVKPASFIVITEATDGVSLATYTRQLVSPPPDKTIIRWFKNLALAVQALHNSPIKITHGSVSLHNVYFRNSPANLKLLLPITTLSKRSIAKQSLDIDPYTAPERVEGTISPGNDIWSLCICFLELLTREPAYSEIKTPIELVDALLEHRLPESIAKVKNMQALDLIKKCLQPKLFRLNINDLLADPIFAENTEKPEERFKSSDALILV